MSDGGCEDTCVVGLFLLHSLSFRSTVLLSARAYRGAIYAFLAYVPPSYLGQAVHLST